MKPSDISATDARKAIADEAAHWYVVLHGESCTASDERAFAEWVARSPECVAAYLRITSALGSIRAGDVRWPDTSVEKLIAEAKAEGNTVTALPGSGGRKSADGRAQFSRSRWPWWLPAVAAAVFVISIAGWLWARAPRAFETEVGEQRSVVLQDGSVVTLNTSSTIAVDLRRDRRVIQLTRGEALFQVAQDRTRPFDVIVGSTVVRAVGTEFDIDHRDSHTTVTVVEGRVRVSTQESGDARVGDTRSGNAAIAVPERMLATAERVVIAGNVLGEPERVANVVPVTAWTQRRLVFERRALGDVAEEFNRYNRQHIRVYGTELRQQEVTGLFQANDPESFVAFLAGIPEVRIERAADGDYLVHDDTKKNLTPGGPN
jgi:transmembrane sensor